jgi:predicted Zn-dependent protease
MENAMQLRRRMMLFSLPALFLSPVCFAQSAESVPVYLVPLDDFPEELAAIVAKSLQTDLNVRVKSSGSLPPLQIATLPETNQLVAESILVEGAKASVKLPETTITTYRVFLTVKDINSPNSNYRFQLSSHDKSLNCSVVSLARLVEYSEQSPVLTQLAVLRLLKMTKRAIGEMYLGWSRSPDPNDLMYSPLMSLDDLDKTGFTHTEHPVEEVKPAVSRSPADTI